VLGYFELPKDEVPDENIWHHSARLEEWFEAVEHRRKNPELQPIDAGNDDLTQNELTRGLRD
jgi:hypothetical protein